MSIGSQSTHTEAAGRFFSFPFFLKDPHLLFKPTVSAWATTTARSPTLISCQLCVSIHHNLNHNHSDLVEETGPSSAAYLRAVAFKELALDWAEMSKEAKEDVQKPLKPVLTAQQSRVVEAGRLLLDALGNVNTDRWQEELQSSGIAAKDWIGILKHLATQIQEEAALHEVQAQALADFGFELEYRA